MKKRVFIASLAALTAALHSGDPMKLINTKTRYVVVEFANGKACFHDRFLEAEMKETGILIPPEETPKYHGKEVIYLDDAQFEKAFIEVYYPLCIANTLYQWEN